MPKNNIIAILKENYTARNTSKEYTETMSILQPYLQRMDPGRFTKVSAAKTITLQVTEDCNLACTYCYQINKSPAKMSFETAKKFIDLILSDDKTKNSYINRDNADIVILDFIGGEPLLEIDLIDNVVDYFLKRCIELDHPWMYGYMLSIGSNGTLYQTPKVQRFLEKHLNRLSLNITVDGDKELHDSCRVFHDGTGSYDLASFAATDWMKRTNGASKSTKITIAPGNVKHLKNALINMIDLGFNHINENCVYEDVWNSELAHELFVQLIGIADYIVDNDLETKISLRIFDPSSYVLVDPYNNENWCGGNASMLACDPNGDLFNCVRYMKSSLGEDIEPLVIGNVDLGIGTTDLYKENIKKMSCVNRRSQSTDKCYWCPIGQGCGWCSAYNYQYYGTVNKRTETTCQMHTASSLASNYYWNRVLEKHGYEERLRLTTPRDWALEIVSEKEYEDIRKSAKSLPFESKEWYESHVKPVRINPDNTISIIEDTSV